jgi:hypothetical protein
MDKGIDGIGAEGQPKVKDKKKSKEKKGFFGLFSKKKSKQKAENVLCNYYVYLYCRIVEQTNRSQEAELSPLNYS